jgi:hypothetical protein
MAFNALLETCPVYPPIKKYIHYRGGFAYMDIEFFADHQLLPQTFGTRSGSGTKRDSTGKKVKSTLSHVKMCIKLFTPRIGDETFIIPDHRVSIAAQQPTLLLFPWFAFLMQSCPPAKLICNSSRLQFQNHWFGHSFDINSMQNDDWIAAPISLHNHQASFTLLVGENVSTVFVLSGV